ncbi:hypothetical protein ACFLYU_04785 [Candidatus Dependentiae bacterium]
MISEKIFIKIVIMFLLAFLVSTSNNLLAMDKKKGKKVFYKDKIKKALKVTKALKCRNLSLTYISWGNFRDCYVIFDISNGEQKLEIKKASRLDGYGLLKNGKYVWLAVGSFLKIFDAESVKLVLKKEIKEHPKEVVCMCKTSKNGLFLVFRYFNNSLNKEFLRFYKTKSLNGKISCKKVFEIEDIKLRTYFDFTNDGKYFVVLLAGRCLRIFDTLDWTHKELGGVKNYKLSSNSKSICVKRCKPDVKMFDFEVDHYLCLLDISSLQVKFSELCMPKLSEYNYGFTQNGKYFFVNYNGSHHCLKAVDALTGKLYLEIACNIKSEHEDKKNKYKFNTHNQLALCDLFWYKGPENGIFPHRLSLGRNVKELRVYGLPKGNMICNKILYDYKMSCGKEKKINEIAFTKSNKAIKVFYEKSGIDTFFVDLDFKKKMLNLSKRGKYADTKILIQT